MAVDEPATTERDNVERLADAFLASYRAGKCPSIEEFVHDYPELADELRDLLKALVLLEENGPAARRESLPTDRLPRQIGDFLVLREIGRGGMGIVYEAAQQSLDRHVALKVLSTRSLLNPAHLERFRREARAAARLQHSNIVSVFEFGAHDGTYYYAMQYVPGQSLDMVIESLRRTRSKAECVGDTRVPTAPAGDNASANKSDCVAPDCDTRATKLSDTEFTTSAGRRQFYCNVARIGLQAAEALAYAHSEGILHRDVKPSNLLLDAKGNIWITDFGLAKAKEEDELTRTGDFVGTLSYTAPERLDGWSDRRSDIYGLGVTLYELLTLQPFFASRTRAELLRRIMEDSPLAPRRIDPSIPVDLETILLKAVAKEPAARYHRAEQMADDLRRFLADRPILARRSNAIERFSRWCRRNPAVASLATAVVALLVAAVIILAMSNAQIRSESAAKAAALKDREAALNEKDEALGMMWLYRGLYGIDGDDESLRNFDKAMAFAPNNPDILWLRGFTLGSWGRYDEAAADMTKARALLGDSKLISPAARDWFVSMVHMANGDRSAYQAACREALDRIPSEPKAGERGILLWMCTVTPYPVEDATRLADIARLLLPPVSKSPTGDELLDAGAALFRAGKLPDAQECLTHAIPRLADGKSAVDPMSEVFARLYLAMIQYQLGSTEEAEATLDEANLVSKSITPPCWVSTLEHKLLAAEATALIFGPGEKKSGQTIKGG